MLDNFLIHTELFIITWYYFTDLLIFILDTVLFIHDSFQSIDI